MTKSGVLETDPMAPAKLAELKKELQKAVKAVVDEDGGVALEDIDRAQQMLCALKELKLKKSAAVSFKLSNHRLSREVAVGSGAVPEEFKCPLSKELMRDPVIIATGQVLCFLLYLYAVNFLFEFLS